MLLLDRIKWQILSCGINISAMYRHLGYQDKRYLQLKKFKNRYQGKRCFICATGPSLTQEDVEMLKDEYTIGLNSICAMYPDTWWRPKFYVFQDYPVYEMYGDWFNKEGKTIVFSGDPLVDYVRGAKIKGKCIRFPLNWAYHCYTMRTGKQAYVYFSDDCYEKVYSGYTVTYTAIQLAMYMGFKEIYLLGVDCNYSAGKKNHFVKMKKEFIRTTQSAKKECGYQMLAYQKAKEEAERKDVSIYNVTRGGKLEVFPRKKLEEVLNDDKKKI